MSLLKKLQESTNRPSDKEAWNFLVNHLDKATVATGNDGNDAYDASLHPTTCESVEELVLALRAKHKGFHDQPVIDTLMAGLAVAVSLKVPGPMLWMHFVGPSSSLKTTLAKLISSASDKCFSVSKFTGLYSGYKTPGTDNALVPRLQNRVLVINDLTPLLKSDRATFEEVTGQLRDIYDGSGGQFYKNGVTTQYEGVLFGCISCTTDAIRKFGSSDLGERFLMSEINADYDDQGRFRPLPTTTSGQGSAYNSVLNTIASGFDNHDDEAPKLDNLANERAMCWGLINHLVDWISDESQNLAACARAMQQDLLFGEQVAAYAEWLEHARCPLPKRNEDAIVRPRPAQPHRSIAQLTKLAMCLCIVHKSIGLTPLIRRLIRKYALDTAHGLTLEVMNWIATHPKFPRQLLAVRIGYSPTYVDHVCDHLISIGVFVQVMEGNGTGRRGAYAACYTLTDKFRQVADTIGLKPKSPPEDTPKPPPRGLSALLERHNGHKPPSLLRSLREGKQP